MNTLNRLNQFAKNVRWLPVIAVALALLGVLLILLSGPNRELERAGWAVLAAAAVLAILSAGENR